MDAAHTSNALTLIELWEAIDRKALYHTSHVKQEWEEEKMAAVTSLSLGTPPT